MRVSRGNHGRILLLVLCAAAALLLARQRDWQPFWLFAGLAVAAFASDCFVVVVSTELSLTAALVAVVLAGVFLGPLPAAVIGAVSSLVDGTRRSIGAGRALGNVASYCGLGVVAGLISRAVDLRTMHGLPLVAGTAGVYGVVSMATLVFASLNTGAFRWQMVRTEASQTAAAEALLAVTAGVAALLYRDDEYQALVSLGVVAVLFSYFSAALVRARRNADEMYGLAEREARLTARLAEAQSIARRDLAHALHSGPLQTLLSVRQDLAEQEFARAQQGVVASLDELRHVMVDVHIPDTPGSPQASLDGLARALGERHGIAIELGLELTAIGNDSRRVRLAFDAAQELIRNAAKHARATAVQCSMRVENGAIVVVVADDGVGLDTSRLEQAISRGHVGLAALRARAVDEGGSLTIAASEERGTIVRVDLPVEQ